MARLNKAHKRFIVERLACFEEPSEIVEAVKEEFGLEVSRQQVWTYDPTKPANSVSDELTDLFEKARAAFVEATEGIGIAHKRYRLQRLQAMLRQAERMRNYGLAAQILEQAAKEVGGAFTNRVKQEFTGEGGGPVTVKVVYDDGGSASD